MSTVVLQLEAEGKLSINDTVAMWLPGAVNANDNDGTLINIKELLNMTSGIPDHMNKSTIAAPYALDNGRSLCIRSPQRRPNLIALIQKDSLTRANTLPVPTQDEPGDSTTFSNLFLDSRTYIARTRLPGQPRSIMGCRSPGLGFEGRDIGPEWRRDRVRRQLPLLFDSANSPSRVGQFATY